jgi:hypothetical protein
VKRVVLEPFFLHLEQVQIILGSRRSASARARAAGRSDPEASFPYVLATELAGALPALGVGELARCINEQCLHVGLVVGAELEFTFRRARDGDAPGVKPVRFTALLDAGQRFRVTGIFNSARTASPSAIGSLEGSRRAYLVGTITDLSAAWIELRPAFIGIRSFLDEDSDAGSTAQGLRMYPSEISRFNRIDFDRPVADADLIAIRQVPEETVKYAFASLIGESYVPSDWGGERSDLYTSRVFARGRQVSAAWLFKGRGHPYPMTVRALGKPGDQIGRLFSEPAELLVLQHCHQITTAVVEMMDTYAHDLRNPRSYMIIDGADTSRVLKSMRLLPTPPRSATELDGSS